MEKKILICYLHSDFVERILPFLYPESFDKNFKCPKGSFEIIVTTNDNNIKVRTLLGLNEGYKYFEVDDIYIESGLVTEETQKLIESMKDYANIYIYDIRTI